VTDVSRYDSTVAEMWRDGELVGHLYLEVQNWTPTSPAHAPVRTWTLTSPKPTPDSEKDLDSATPSGGRESRAEDLLEWMIVWTAPAQGEEPYVDDVERDTAPFLRELDANTFILRAQNYDLQWIDGPEKRDVLHRVFGIEL
jgi:hypothetical protein